MFASGSNFGLLLDLLKALPIFRHQSFRPGEKPSHLALVDPDLGKVWRGRGSLFEFNPD